MYKKDIHPAESRFNKSDEQIEIVYTLEPSFRLGWKSVQLVTIKGQQCIRRLESPESLELLRPTDRARLRHR
jgi:hypothetical protein